MKSAGVLVPPHHPACYLRAVPLGCQLAAKAEGLRANDSSAEKEEMRLSSHASLFLSVRSICPRKPSWDFPYLPGQNYTTCLDWSLARDYMVGLDHLQITQGLGESHRCLLIKTQCLMTLLNCVNKKDRTVWLLLGGVWEKERVEESSLVLKRIRIGSVTSPVVKITLPGCGKELQDTAHHEGNPLIFWLKGEERDVCSQ